MKKFYYIILLVFTFFSCQNNLAKKSEITKIIFASDAGEGKLSSKVFEINNDFEIKYYGQKNVNKIGYFEGNTNHLFWNALDLKLKQINYLELDSTYINSGIEDDSTVEIFIYSDKNKKHIYGHYSQIPSNLKSIIDWINNAANNFELKRTNKVFTFETKIPLKIPEQKIKFGK